MGSNLLGLEPLPFIRNYNSIDSIDGRSRIFHRARRQFQISSNLKRPEAQDRRDFTDVVYLKGQIPPFKAITNFIRFKNGEELQSAIVTYRKPFPLSILEPNFQVDFVAAVHIADKEYFSSLQELLATYDRVLYEMVVEKDKKYQNKNSRERWMPPKRLNKRLSYVGLIQRLMAKAANMYFQLECLDYRKHNWYHADLDYQTFVNMQVEKGENLFKLAMDMAGTILTSKYKFQDENEENPLKRLWNIIVPRLRTQAGQKDQIESEDDDTWRSRVLKVSQYLPKPLLLSFLVEYVCASPSAPITESPEMKAFFRLDLAAAVKVFLAKQITSNVIDGTSDLVVNSVIIGERNKIAMEELERAMKDGCKKIAIFYGGGHMPDLDRRVREEFQLVPSQISWKTAWAIETRRVGSQKELPALLKRLITSIGWQLNRYQVLALLLFSLVLATDLWFWELFIIQIKDWAA